MKSIFILLLAGLLQGPSPIHRLQFSSISGKTISMADFSGKQLLIIPVDEADVSIADFKFWDSIQSSSMDLQVIIVPKKNPIRQSVGNGIQNRLSLVKSKMVIAQPSKTDRNAEALQHPIFQWLMNPIHTYYVSEDPRPGQYFIVSPKGALLFQCEREPSHEQLLSILAIPFEEPDQYLLNPETQKYDLQ